MTSVSATPRLKMDYHNNDLVAEVMHFIECDKKNGDIFTDHEWLEHLASIVNQRKIVFGTTDCTTGLTYKEGK